MKEDLLFSKLIINYKGLTVYEEINSYFELKSISLEHLVAIYSYSYIWSTFDDRKI